MSFKFEGESKSPLKVFGGQVESNNLGPLKCPLGSPPIKADSVNSIGKISSIHETVTEKKGEKCLVMHYLISN